MKTDLYTKTVLTIIAIALIVLAFQNGNMIPSANAARNSTSFATVPVNPDGTITVRVKSLPTEIMDVNVKEFDSNALRYLSPLEVKIASTSANAFNSAGPITVKIRQ